MNLDIDYSECTVLVVDDNPTNLQIVNRVLGMKKFKVMAALSAMKAMELINKVIPDIIICDIMMPEIDGLTFASNLSQDSRFSEIPIIFLTAKSDYSDIVKGFKSGGVDYIVKPANNEELLMRINNQLKIKFSKDIIKQQNKELEELIKEKNEILGIAAHDLKNPLTGIIGLSDIIKNYNDKLSPEEILHYNDNISKAAKKMFSLISDILVANSYDNESLRVNNEEFDFVYISNEAFESFYFKAQEKSINLIIENELENLNINSDPKKLTNIIDNLLSNAIKFSPLNKSILIKTGLKEIDDKQYAYFSIKDEGPGFTDDDKTKLFKKFTKLSATPTNDESSTGLGLSIVKKITECLSGNIVLESNQGEGAEFILTLPINN